MPLPSPSSRQPLHTRRVECCGYRRNDGLWDIEGHVVDTKPYDIPGEYGRAIKANQPVHDMWVRLTVTDDLVVEDITAVTDASPYPACVDAHQHLAAIKGLRIGPGWNSEIKRRTGGAKGCTHVVELLGSIATTAYQTLAILRREQPERTPLNGPAGRIDSCFAYRRSGNLVRQRWPELFEKPDDPPLEGADVMTKRGAESGD